MPANLTPDYKAAEKAFRRAREPRERLEHLREMLRTIPKHKGTEHLQADIRSRIKELSDELAGPKRTGARTAPPTFIRPEGAAQVALLGPPNTGKSALHGALTGSHSPAGPYPFTTRHPQPGMLAVDDVTLQLVDLPPVSREHPVPWIGNALAAADGALLVIDLGRPGAVEEVVVVHELLDERKVRLTAEWPYRRPAEAEADDELDPFGVELPALAVFTGADRINRLGEEIAVFRELTGYHYDCLEVSATRGDGLDAVGPALFDRLGVVRVYTKIPGKPPDLGRPYTVRRGDTVHDVAMLVHRDLAGSLQYARLWHRGDDTSLQAGRDHVVADGDVVELHS